MRTKVTRKSYFISKTILALIWWGLLCHANVKIFPNGSETLNKMSFSVWGFLSLLLLLGTNKLHLNLLLLTWWPSSVCHVNDYDIWIFLRYMKRSIIPERVKENEKALWPGEQHLKWIWERNQLKMPLKFIFLSV